MAVEQKAHSPNIPNRLLYAAAFIIAALVLAGTAMFASKGTATGWEYTWLAFINGWSESLYRPMFLMTFLGSTWMAVISVAGTFFARMYHLAWRLAVTIVGAYGVTYILKELIGRARPAEMFTTIHARVAESEMGFPSGHATLVTVIVLTVLPYLRRPWQILVGLLALLVMLSRLYLGVHLPLDIIGGVAVGVCAVSFVRLLPSKLQKWLRLT